MLFARPSPLRKLFSTVKRAFDITRKRVSNVEKSHDFHIKSSIHTHSDNIDLHLTQIDMSELKAYEKFLNREEMDILMKILSGYTMTKLNKSNITRSLNIFEKLELQEVTDNHLFLLCKFFGCSVIRKWLFFESREAMLECYFELKRRGLLFGLNIDSMLVTDEKYDPIHTLNCEAALDRDPELLGQVKDIVAELEEDKDRLENIFHVLVGLSNLSIYYFDHYEMVKLLIYCANKYKLDVPNFHSLVGFKMTNIYWAYKRVGVRDTSWINTLFNSYSYKFLDEYKVRILQLLFSLSVEYALTSNQGNNIKLKDMISQSMECYIELTSTGKEVFNTKDANMILQTILSLFPEVGPYITQLREGEAVADKSNPFNRYFPDLKRKLITALWISKDSIVAKKDQSHSNLTYLENRALSMLILKKSVFKFTGNWERNVMEIIKEDKRVQTIEPNHIVGWYEIDYLINGNLCLELDTAYHYNYGINKKQNLSHLLKEIHLKTMGIAKISSIDYPEKILERGPKLQMSVKEALDRLFEKSE